MRPAGAGSTRGRMLRSPFRVTSCGRQSNSLVRVSGAKGAADKSTNRNRRRRGRNHGADVEQRTRRPDHGGAGPNARTETTSLQTARALRRLRRRARDDAGPAGRRLGVRARRSGRGGRRGAAERAAGSAPQAPPLRGRGCVHDPVLRRSGVHRRRRRPDGQACRRGRRGARGREHGSGGRDSCARRGGRSGRCAGPGAVGRAGSRRAGSRCARRSSCARGRGSRRRTGGSSCRGRRSGGSEPPPSPQPRRRGRRRRTQRSQGEHRPGARRPCRPKPRQRSRAAPAKKPGAKSVLKRAAAPAPVPEIEREHGEPTIWLNRALPDPTPASARLKRSFARKLKLTAKRHGADWAAVLAVLRADGHRGSVPATQQELDRARRRGSPAVRPGAARSRSQAAPTSPTRPPRWPTCTARSACRRS